MDKTLHVVLGEKTVPRNLTSYFVGDSHACFIETFASLLVKTADAGSNHW